MQHRRGALLVALALALTGVFALAAPRPAQALTTEKATARPNEDGGDGVIGGMDTRLTWEGTVEEDGTMDEIKQKWFGTTEI